MKKKLKKTPTRSVKAASQNQFGVILEDISGKFDLLIEGQKSLEQRFFGLEGEVAEFKKDTKSNFNQIFEYLSRIEDELISIKAEIADIKKTLTQKADKDRVALLEERVAKLERQLVQAKH